MSTITPHKKKPMDQSKLEIIDLLDDSIENAKKIVHASSTQGFLMFEGHGFTQADIDLLFQFSHDYFKLPLEEKNKCPIETDNTGYTGLGVENLEEDDLDRGYGDPKEGFNFANFDLKTGIPKQKIPEFWIDKMDVISKTVLKLRDALKRSLRLLAVGLEIEGIDGVDPEWFVERHHDDHFSGTTFRFLRYPSPVDGSASEEEKDKFSELNVAGAHTDYGTVTLLFQKQEESGLQLYSQQTKKWESVPYVPASAKYQAKGEAAPLIVNIADQLCYWTNGHLKSTIHRVRFPRELLDKGKDRYSIVLFAHPGDETLLEPVPSKIISQIKGRGASHHMEKHGVAQTAGQHLTNRLNSTYGWKY
jgi:isopenicillin N synthase-like dioxygenase